MSKQPVVSVLCSRGKHAPDINGCWGSMRDYKTVRPCECPCHQKEKK